MLQFRHHACNPSTKRQSALPPASTIGAIAFCCGQQPAPDHHFSRSGLAPDRCKSTAPPAGAWRDWRRGRAGRASIRDPLK
jgi:hypothetical protein